MTTITQSRLVQLDTEIAKARAVQLAARQAWAHSPCAANVLAEKQACAEVDGLLEMRHRMMTSERIVSA